MKKIMRAAVGLVFLGWVGMASAAPSPTGAFFAEDDTFVDFDRFNTSFTWIFDLDKDPVFSAMPCNYGDLIDINAEDIISEAELALVFLDDERDIKAKEYATLKLDGKNYFKNMEIDSDVYSFAGVETLLQDHVLSVTVKRNAGDFSVASVLLGGKYVDVAPVPEPTTMFLFGIGLAGLAAFGRKRKN